ncbi:endoplasmic reticulum-intermediate compartment protein (macronuclear) [Tetrahymena thermophila SB210]|uniref:Endoplasmic reticulum-intermediate compartment protein n=1 Tax=Tetrahymena thermophila (strain SB210) TaxID=312017 RepID=Q23BZ1_TETTS|nr:endoplasmic reticulum-intermediate compartment protein [Tetrahymena thermophila SB210]EAR93977.2 endoplasmic reticulum-intermediate compartment protein [Tetrahymena thermophila SB210]|eukprot:XP_001014222.2 endoplasmic reticulum-intermediate compartment protein [Tetrahymena thermophila SB210]
MKLVEFFKSLDLFSEPVQFNSSRQKFRKRTFLGAILTLLIILITIIYFVYQSYQYFTGQMDPKFISQTYVSQNIDIQVNNEMFGFDYLNIYNGQYLNQLQEQQNKTYIVFVGAFLLTNGTKNEIIYLDIIKCQNPELKGLNCFDFSKIPSAALVLLNNDTIFSYINLLLFRCQDVDSWKSFVPDNCADQQSIDNFINLEPFMLNVKIQVSQFNTTSQQIEYQYRTQTFINQANTFSYNEIRVQSQQTKVKQGFLIQSEQKFSSPYSYQLKSQVYNRDQMIQAKGIQCFCQIIIISDETVTYFKIQYPIFTEVLALCNSTLALLLLLGSYCRRLAQNIIRRDIFFILMKDFFSGTYLNILEHNKIVDTSIQTEENLILQDAQVKEKSIGDTEENNKNSILPYLTPKSNQKVFQQNNDEIADQDYIKEDTVTSVKQTDSSGIDFQMPMKLQKFNENDQTPKIFRKKYLVQQPQQQMRDSKNSQTRNQYVFSKHENIDKDQSNFNNVQEKSKKYNNYTIKQLNQHFQTLNDKSMQLKLEQIIYKPKCIKRKEFLSSKGLKQKIISDFEKSVDDSLDFFTFYKEILLLKKAIMILLNKEQFAALQIVGMDVEIINQNKENKALTNQTEEKYGNHFREQYELLQSKELQLQYINDFLKRCQYNNQSLDNLDKRILSSLLINQ